MYLFVRNQYLNNATISCMSSSISIQGVLNFISISRWTRTKNVTKSAKVQWRTVYCKLITSTKMANVLQKSHLHCKIIRTLDKWLQRKIVRNNVTITPTVLHSYLVRLVTNANYGLDKSKEKEQWMLNINVLSNKHLIKTMVIDVK